MNRRFSPLPGRYGLLLILVSGGLFLWVLGSLFLPSMVPIGRDQLLFHLPLRAALETAADQGRLLQWNPALNGGQPVLSNPNYAAFYPPTWLLLLVSAEYSINLLMLAHVLWGFIGCWRLLTRLDCSSLPATAGSLGFAMAPWYLGLATFLPTLSAMSWWPWVLYFGIAALDPSEEIGSRRGPILLTAGALALQLLAGEPITVLATVLSLAIVGLAEPGRRLRVERLAVIGVLASLLASIQLLPTTQRVLDSPRATGTDSEVQMLWSLPLSRLTDFAFPRWWGDPHRDGEGLYFGRGVHDRSLPYLESLYSGLPLLIFALPAFFRGRIPYRRAWGLIAASGVFLGLGGNNPLLAPIYPFLPILNMARYPERLTVLTSAAISIAAALALQDYLTTAERRRGPLLAAGAATLAGSAVLLVLHLRTDLAHAFINRSSGFIRAEPDQLEALRYLQSEALFSTAIGGALFLVLLLKANQQKGSEGELSAWVPVLLLLILGSDLFHHSKGAVVTASTEILSPPEIVQTVTPGSRVVTTLGLTKDPLKQLRVRPVGLQEKLRSLSFLVPYSGNLWGISYALNGDFDLMATRWARHGRSFLPAVATDPTARENLVAAWAAEYLIEPRPEAELLAEFRAGAPGPDVQLVRVPAPLDHVRSVTTLGAIETASDAEPWLANRRFDVSRSDTCIGATHATANPSAQGTPARVLDVRMDPGQLLIDYRSSGPGFLVVAETFHDGWAATLSDVSGTQIDLCPTALGQIGLFVPSGQHRVELRFRDRWVLTGAVVSLLTLVASLIWSGVLTRRS